MISKQLQAKRKRAFSRFPVSTARESPSVLAGRASVHWVLVLLSACVSLLLILWPFWDVSRGGDHYVYLARSFADGSLSVDRLPAWYRDYVVFEGHKYLPFGPLPALLLVPFVWALDAGLPLVFFAYALTVLNVFLLNRVIAQTGAPADTRAWLVLLFFGGTVYLSVALAGISTFFAHVVVTTFLLLAIHETLGKRRPLLVGLLVGLAAAARFTALFTIPFFLWLLWRSASPPPGSREEPSPRFGRLGLAFAGLAVPVLILAAYNYARFGDPTETGFGISLLYTRELEQARSVGLFSIQHVPKNLFMLLLNGPQPVGGGAASVLRFPYIEPSPWGMGIFFTSPWLVYLFRARLSETLVQACWLATGVTLIPILSYYGIGFVQFGYRYALDFMPFLAIIASRGMPRRVTRTFLVVATASVIINIWGAIVLAEWI